MPNLEELFRQTLEDEVLSRSERKALAKILLEEPLDQREKQVLRSKIFQMAGSVLEDDEDRRILQWLYEANKLLARGEAKEVRGENQVYFSPGDACLETIKLMVRQARFSLDICVFTISDDRITREILNRAQQGLTVRILTDNEKLHDKGSDIDRMAAAGISVRIDATHHHMHHKFALVDDRYILTGSYNWTRSAAEYNEENLLVSDDANTIRQFQKKFDELWAEMQPYT
ncbi:MAG: phospholipase D-like domain-containing protein [Bacteroidota bacterium]